jgi:hypothetical protein
VPADRPLEVGAQCVLKPLLPLKRDMVEKLWNTCQFAGVLHSKQPPRKGSFASRVRDGSVSLGGKTLWGL